MYSKTGFSVSQSYNSCESQYLEKFYSNPPVCFTFKATDVHLTKREIGAFLASIWPLTEICDELHPFKSASHSSSPGIPNRQINLIIWYNLLGHPFCNIPVQWGFTDVNVFKDFSMTNRQGQIPILNPEMQFINFVSKVWSSTNHVFAVIRLLFTCIEKESKKREQLMSTFICKLQQVYMKSWYIMYYKQDHNGTAVRSITVTAHSCLCGRVVPCRCPPSSTCLAADGWPAASGAKRGRREETTDWEDGENATQCLCHTEITHE